MMKSCDASKKEIAESPYAWHGESTREGDPHSSPATRPVN